MNEIPRAIPRMLDQLPVIPPRDDRHEEAPFAPPPEKTGRDKIVEMAIMPIRQTGQRLLDKFPPLHERLNQAEQIVIKAMADSEAIINAEVDAMEVVAKITQDIEDQIKEVMEPLAALTNGK